MTVSHAWPQVNIPVLVPGQPPMSVALLGLQRSDMRLLHVAAKLGPLISRAAQEATTQKVATMQTRVIKMGHLAIERLELQRNSGSAAHLPQCNLLWC